MLSGLFFRATFISILAPSVPEWFADALERDHRGSLRLRWSPAKNEFQIEQKVGRASLPPIRIADGDDSLIRARDGYWLVLSFTPFRIKGCPRCAAPLEMPVFEWAEVRCARCKIMGLDGRVSGCYFPFCEKFLAHLRRISPERDGARTLAAEVDLANERAVRARERATSNHLESVTKDHFNRLVGIPSVGYTGKEFHADH